MATKKAPVLDPEIEIEHELDDQLDEDMELLDDMVDDTVDEAEFAELFEASLTTAVPKKKNEYKGPRVTVFLPKLDDSGDEGIKVDQYEHVTLANERGETCYKILRGEYVDVPVPVFIALKEKYPKL